STRDLRRRVDGDMVESEHANEGGRYRRLRRDRQVFLSHRAAGAGVVQGGFHLHEGGVVRRILHRSARGREVGGEVLLDVGVALRGEVYLAAGQGGPVEGG